MQDFRKMKVWQMAHATVLGIYSLSRRFPPEERYGITAQLRRSAVSIGSNIAEGRGRGGDLDFAHFLQNALGSANEVQYLLMLARDLDLLARPDFARIDPRLEEVRRMLLALLRKLRGSGF
ncbi:MAG TPA: four helix bundle protein [Planctomycetota bacterium]|nr:four helix bundle protein [Planctomycetota bacterium]